MDEKIDRNVGTVNVFIPCDATIVDMMETGAGVGGHDMAEFVRLERDLRVEMCQILETAIHLAAEGQMSEEIVLFYQNELHKLVTDAGDRWTNLHKAARTIDQYRMGG